MGHRTLPIRSTVAPSIDRRVSDLLYNFAQDIQVERRVNYPALTGRPKIILQKNNSDRIISNS